jgi:phospholipid transport system substrate-binding protein
MVRNVLAASLLWAGLLLAAVAGPTPGTVVSAMMEQFLAQAGRPGAHGDLPGIRALVQAIVMPDLDFRAMTARAVGPYWRSATDDQRTRLMEGFEALLINTYSGAFGDAAGATFKVKATLPMDPSTTLVRTEVRSPDAAQPVQIEYRLSLEGGDWKVTDFSVMGIWLVDIYHTQFEQVLQASGVDGLIRTLEAKAARP